MAKRLASQTGQPPHTRTQTISSALEIGTPSCPVTATAEASADCRPRNSKAKFSDPIMMEIRSRVNSLSGTGLRKGIRNRATPAKRTAAKKRGGTCMSATGGENHGNSCLPRIRLFPVWAGSMKASVGGTGATFMRTLVAAFRLGLS